MSQKRSAEAARFISVDVHDDTVESIAVLPALSKRGAAKVQVTLCRHWKRRRRVLEFSGCANIELLMDGDVLRGNSPNNTSGVAATTSTSTITRTMKRHRGAWNVSYERAIDPMHEKLRAADSLVLFEVLFFGGKLNVIAKGYRLRHLTTPRSGP